MVNLEERILEESHKDALKSTEFSMYLKRITEAEKEIIESLGSSKLLLECESLICIANNLQLKSAYKIGFNDGKSCPKTCLKRARRYIKIGKLQYISVN